MGPSDILSIFLKPLIPNPRNAKQRKEAKVRQGLRAALFHALTIVA